MRRLLLAVVVAVGLATASPALASANTFTIAHCQGSLYYWNYPGDNVGDDEIAQYDAKYGYPLSYFKGWSDFHWSDGYTIRGWAVYQAGVSPQWKVGVWCSNYLSITSWNDGMTGV